MSWRPLASAIVGPRRVRVSTSTGSRAALAAAGKVAATTGDTIHLARPLTGASDAPLLAHELTHVAAPSPLARFYDDDRDSPEERRAQTIAEVIRRSPVLPRPTAGGPTPSVLGRPAPAAVVRRHVAAAPAVTPSAPGTVSADDLAQRLSGRSPASTIRRSPTSTASRAPAAPTIQRTLEQETSEVEDTEQPSTVRAPGSSPSTAARTWPILNRDLDTSGLLDLADWIMEQIEDRIERELDRRGGRYRGGF